MKKMIMTAVLCACVLAFASSAMAWTLVYAHDANGVATYGNLQVLIDAISAGKQVRFSIEGTGSVVVFDAQTIEVTNGIVFAQNTSHVGWFNGADGSVGFNAPGYYGFYAVSTQGNATLSRWRVGEHTSEGDTQHRWGMKWFVS
jgi:hypothetical protein